VSALPERVRRAQKDNPILMEVVLNPPSEETETMASTLEGNSQEKDDSIAQEEKENVGRPLKPAQQESTLEKSPSEDEMTAKSNENVPGKADVTSKTKATDGFQTPSKKHRVPAASLKEIATATEAVIVTNNPYLPLTSLGMTRSRGTSPKKFPTSECPQKKKTKVNPAFMQAMDDAFAKQKEALDSGLDEKTPWQGGCWSQSYWKV
jgi:hypothetical protein